MASLIDEQQETAQRVQQQQLGNTKEPIEDAAQWVADLIRTRLKTEVSVINQGTLRSLTLDGDIQLGTLANLVRYDDILVRVEVLGSQLKAMADSSAKRTFGKSATSFFGVRCPGQLDWRSASSARGEVPSGYYLLSSLRWGRLLD